MSTIRGTQIFRIVEFANHIGRHRLLPLEMLPAFCRERETVPASSSFVMVENLDGAAAMVPDIQSSDGPPIPGDFPNSPAVARAHARSSSPVVPATERGVDFEPEEVPEDTAGFLEVDSVSSQTVRAPEDSEIFETSDRDAQGSPALANEPKEDLAATEVESGIEGNEDEVEVGEDVPMVEESSPGIEQDEHPFDEVENDARGAEEDDDEAVADDQDEANTGEKDEEEDDPEDKEAEEDSLTLRGSKGKGRRVLVDTESSDSMSLKVLTFLIFEDFLDLFSSSFIGFKSFKEQETWEEFRRAWRGVFETLEEEFRTPSFRCSASDGPSSRLFGSSGSQE